MVASRTIPFGVHAVIETIAAPMVMVAPLVLDFSQGATVVTFAVGALLLSLALQGVGPRRAIPLSAHAGWDYMVAAVAVVAGLLIGMVTGAWAQGIFLVGIGAAQAALTASTRFSVPAGA
jgi:hypothetical protein